AQTIRALELEVLHGNTACAHVVRLARLACSAAAYCSARARLPLAVYERLLEHTSRAAQRSFREPLWRGHRTFCTDGSGCSMPDTKQLREHFGQPGMPRAAHAVSRLVRKLGRYDQIVQYRKPPVCPRWMTAEQFAALPETIEVRELRFWTRRRGFRTRVVTLVTTLLDAQADPADELAA